MKTKEIMKYYGDSDLYVIYVPVYYEYEDKPAWRKVFVGTEKECKNNFESFPDNLIATYEENKINREWKRKEYQLMLGLKKYKKAEEIKEQYCL